MTRWIHKLINKDINKKIAICSHCGPVEIKISRSLKTGKINIRCKNAYRADKKKIKPSSITVRPEKCEICGEKKKLVMDHKHGEDKMRGWLCNSCNVILGKIKEDTNVLQNMIIYLNNANSSRGRTYRSER